LLIRELVVEAQADADAASSSAAAAAGSASAAATSATNAANSAASIDVTSFLQKANNLSDLTSASTARTNLGLGTAATTASTAYATAAQGTKADSALQPAAIGVSVQGYDSDLAAFALKTAPSGAVVGTTDTQTLTNKTLTTPTVDKISDASGGVLAPISSVMRNRIINGAMVIDQRNAGASVATSSGTDVYTLDRWVAVYSATTKYTVQQNAGSVTPPVGFNNYLGVTSSSAYSVLASDYFAIVQRIEGYNVADLGWGTANAKTVTLSFWVNSSLTGTFGGSITNNAENRSYPFSYTVSAANTWEQKSVTIAGDTSGTWLTTNGSGLKIWLGLGMGSTFSGTAGSWSGSALYSATGATSVVGTSGATFYITGVQLEVGSQATGFEYRQYGTELNLCQRYFAKLGGTTSGEGLGAGNIQDAANSGWFYVKYPVTMRTAPTAAFSSLLASNNADYNLTVSSIRGQVSGIDSSNIGFNFSSSGTAYAAVQLQTSATAGFLSYSAEL
jgi:hypothetical protein